MEYFGVRDRVYKGITADEEYSKNPDLKKEDIQALRSWMKTQPHLPQEAPGKSSLPPTTKMYQDEGVTL